MKKIFLIISYIMVFIPYLFAQKADSLQSSNNLTPRDSIFLEYMDVFISQLREPEYKLYPTTNMWTFLKLNTATGQIWQVQYSINGDRFQYKLDIKSRLSEWDERICGRFELHPTQNNHTFILFDNINGKCWQVQWSIDDDERFVLPIY